MSCSVASAARKARGRRLRRSGLSSGASTAAGWGVIVRVAAPRSSRWTRQMPATNPSSVNVLSDSCVARRARGPSRRSMTRERSAYDSSMFSKSYRKRGGAGRVGIGPRCVGQVEQLAAGLVAEREEPRPEALEDLAEPGQAAPRLGVHHARRPEGAPGSASRPHRARQAPPAARRARPRSTCGRSARSGPTVRGAAPGRAARRSGWPARAPNRSRSGQRVRRWSPSALKVRGSLVHEGATHRDDLVEVDAGQALAELALLDPIHDRLDERPETPGVAGGDQVDRPAHQRHAGRRSGRRGASERSSPRTPPGASTARHTRCAASAPASRRGARASPGPTAGTGAAGAVDQGWRGSGRGGRSSRPRWSAASVHGAIAGGRRAVPGTCGRPAVY